MPWLQSILREIIGLFVDDGAFALAILLWIILTVAIHRIAPATHWTGPLLFLGLAAILIESALRYARTRK